MTIEYILQRFSDNRESTLGLLFRQTAQRPFFVAYTLEDEGRDVKVNGDTRIPTGRYQIVINREITPLTKKYIAKFPSWFKFHLMLKDVPGFKGIYIHLGNFDDNTAGCILVGDSANNNSLGDGEIRSSTQAYMRIYNSLYDHLDHMESPGPGKPNKYINQAFLTVRSEQHLKL
jgi:hypothetical protein